MRALLARLLGATSDPHLVELREIERRLGVVCGLLSKIEMQAVVTNALLGRIEKALTKSVAARESVASAPAPSKAADVGAADTRDEGSAREVTSPAPLQRGDEGRDAPLHNPDRVEGHGGDSLAAADAQQPGPTAAPEAPAATLPDPAAHWSDPVALADELSAEQGPEEGASAPPLGEPPAAATPSPALSRDDTARDRVLAIITVAAEAGAVTPARAEMAAAIGMSAAYVADILDSLTQDKLIRRVGVTNGLRFVLPSGAMTRPRIARKADAPGPTSPPPPAPSAEVVPIRPAPPAAAHVDPKPVIPDGPRAYLPPEEHRRAMAVLRERGAKVITKAGGKFWVNGETIDGAELVRRANEAGAA